MVGLPSDGKLSGEGSKGLPSQKLMRAPRLPISFATVPSN